jgi:parallel beta helix pectate lyase-like protein
MANRSYLRVLCVGLLALAFSAGAIAQQRTFVASSGNDANPCTPPAPCRSFAVAILAVAAGGEVIVLDSAGYGPVTIAKSVSITAPAGVYAGIAVPAAQNGVTVSGGTFDVVLRGLAISGNSAGNKGIAASHSGSLTIERCTIEAMSSDGINVAPSSSSIVVAIRDTHIARVSGNGIYLAVSSGSVDHVSVTRVGGRGIYVSTSSSVAVSDAVVAYTQSDGIVGAASGGQTTRLAVTNSTLSNIVGYGIVAADFGGVAIVHATGNTLSFVQNGGLLAQSLNAKLIATRNSVADAQYGLVQSVGGTLFSFGDNPATGKVTPTSGTITYNNWQ